MVAVEIIVALIGGGVSIVTPLLGYYIYKWKTQLDKNKTDESGEEPESEPEPEPEPEPEQVAKPSEERYCQILETDVARIGVFPLIGGIPLINSNRCHETKSYCPNCKKYFCPYHKPRNNNGDPNGGHICPNNP